MRPEKPASSKSTPRLLASQAIVVAVKKKRMFLLLENYSQKSETQNPTEA
jgi:hypothetical protein